MSFPPPPRAGELPGDDDGDDGWVYTLSGGRVVLAEDSGGQLLPAARLPAAYTARELRARGWALQAHGQGICHVIAWHPAVVRDGAGWWQECQASAAREDPPVCAAHWIALRTPHTGPAGGQ